MSKIMHTHIAHDFNIKTEETQRTVLFTTENKEKEFSFFGAPQHLLSSLPSLLSQSPVKKGKPFWVKNDGHWYYIINIDPSNPENAAETFFSAIKQQALTELSIALFDVDINWLTSFHLRVLIQSYSFTKYMRTSHPEQKKVFLLENLTIHTNTPFNPVSNTNLATSILWARDLGNEPSNVCTPQWLADHIVSILTPLGIEIDVLDEDDITRIGMNALMGVAKGSRNKPKVVIMKYMNGKKDVAPTVLLGKGVCFDSGGISLKPAANMGDMKDDMMGAAVVSSSIRALALNDVKVNVIALIGLVENMPDGNAQKPGDIVTTLSGQTVEIGNTDAEGRLVLCDLMWYAQDKFKPRCMVDYATLTGAIVIALGKKYGGLFSNNDQLSNELLAAGIESDDQLWRMPLCKEYDQSIDSKVADIDNCGPREASSSTAAHFIGRFCNDIPWAHLDIAGTAFGKTPSNRSPVVGATGFGVHLTYTWLSKCDTDNTYSS